MYKISQNDGLSVIVFLFIFFLSLLLGVSFFRNDFVPNGNAPTTSADSPSSSDEVELPVVYSINVIMPEGVRADSSNPTTISSSCSIDEPIALYFFSPYGYLFESCVIEGASTGHTSLVKGEELATVILFNPTSDVTVTLYLHVFEYFNIDVNFPADVTALETNPTRIVWGSDTVSLFFTAPYGFDFCDLEVLGAVEYSKLNSFVNDLSYSLCCIEILLSNVESDVVISFSIMQSLPELSNGWYSYGRAVLAEDNTVYDGQVICADNIRFAYASSWFADYIFENFTTGDKTIDSMLTEKITAINFHVYDADLGCAYIDYEQATDETLSSVLIESLRSLIVEFLISVNGDPYSIFSYTVELRDVNNMLVSHTFTAENLFLTADSGVPVNLYYSAFFDEEFRYDLLNADEMSEFLYAYNLDNKI